MEESDKLVPKFLKGFALTVVCCTVVGFVVIFYNIFQFLTYE